MNFKRIYAIIIAELFHTRRSLEVIIDIFFFALISIVAFGFISKYLIGEGNPIAARGLIVGLIFWEVIRTAQYSISVGALWQIWSRNLSNIFITPVSLPEYLIAYAMVACIKSSIVLAILAVISQLWFGFGLLSLGSLNLVSFFINLMFFSFSTGVFILAAIFRYGTRIQSLAWGIVFIFQPLSAAFFPVSVLPPYLQKIAYLLPSTYVFEGARHALKDPLFSTNYFIIPLILNSIYTILAILFFLHMFAASKDTGQFAKNEG